MKKIVVAEELQLESFPDWLQTYGNSATRSSYHNSVRKFLQDTLNSQSSVEDLVNSYIKQVLSGERSAFRDLESFIAKLKTNDVPPKSQKHYVAAIKQFLLGCCGVGFTTVQTNLLRRKMSKGSRARTREDELGPELLRQILQHCDVRIKALILLLESSGIRVGEALRLRFADVTLDANPPVVYIRTSKDGDPYVSFLSYEAKEALKEWYKVRADYIDMAKGKIRNNLSKVKDWSRATAPPTEDTIFPFTYVSARNGFAKALRTAKVGRKDEFTHIGSIHVHMLRKMFLSQIKKRIPSEVAEQLVGHKTYLSDAYRRYTFSELLQYYKQGEPALLVYGSGAGAEVLDKEKQDLQQELADLKARVAQWEAFTRKFMGMSNDQLTAIGNKVAPDLAEFNRTIAKSPTERA